MKNLARDIPVIFYRRVHWRRGATGDVPDLAGQIARHTNYAGRSDLTGGRRRRGTSAGRKLALGADPRAHDASLHRQTRVS